MVLTHYGNNTFCGVSAHHQNGIVDNKNKILTQGSITAPRHTKMFPLMINEMFCPFTMKAVVKIFNSLQMDTLRRTLDSILHVIDVIIISRTLLTSLRSGHTSPQRWGSRTTQMGTALHDWCVPCSLTLPRRQRGTYLEYHHWQGQSIISCSIL